MERQQNQQSSPSSQEESANVMVNQEQPQPILQVKFEQPGIYQNFQGRKFRTYDPNALQDKFKNEIFSLVDRPTNSKKHKGTNIPKFLVKIFFNSFPNFSDAQHVKRLEEFAGRPQKSRTRFHLKELFGAVSTDRRMNHQNQLNRRVLKRLLHKNYDYILTNKHIRNKRLYIMFCKKMMLRLNNPELIDHIEI